MKGLYTLVISFLSFQMTAQLPENSQEVENQIESITQNFDENADLSFLAERLEDIKSHPIPINFASVEELAEIPFLDVFKIHNLIRYRETTGGIYTAYELLQIKGFDFELIQKLIPFLNFQTKLNKPKLKLDHIIKYSQSSLITRYWRDLQTRKGYRLNAQEGYLGAPNNYYLRFLSQYKNLLSMGLNLQQDAGESFNNSHQNTAVDFISGHLALKNYGSIKTLIIGDFHAEFGQGLSLWTSFARGKALLNPDIKKYARGIRSSSGSEENRFLRGIASTFNWKNFDVSLFASSKSIDANIVSNSNQNEVSALLNSGLHRSLSELEDRKSLQLSSWGAYVKYSGAQLNLGFSLHQVDLNLPVAAPSSLYSRFNFQGSTLRNLSFDVDYVFKDINLFAEVARSQNGGYSTLIGLQSQPSDEFRLNSLFRYFSTDYQAFYHAAFSERASSGERGFYLGMSWNTSKIITWNAFVDVFEFKWPTFKSDFSSHGYDLATQLDFRFTRYFSLYVRLLKGLEQITSSNEESFGTLTEKTFRQRLHLNFSASPNIFLGSRLELVDYNGESDGFIVFQDIKYQFQNIPFHFSLRYAFISTDSYDSRIYAYENDVLYAFSIPAYSGRANRFYGLLHYTLNNNMSLEARYSLTQYSDRNKISSGLQEVNGNRLSQVKIQIRVKF
jgi:hypothetical protein